MPDSILNNTSTTSLLLVGNAESSSIDFIGDKDWWKINVLLGYGYQVWIEGYYENEGTLRDPYLGVYNENGSFAYANDNANYLTYYSYAYLNITSAGSLYLSAEESGGNATGSYTITLWEDALASVLSAAVLTVNSSNQVNRLGWQNDISDWYRINLVAGVQYQFEMVGYDGDGNSVDLTLSDPFLFLRNNSGAYLSSDDDSGVGKNAKIIYTPAISGNYFLDAQILGEGYGTYRIIVNSLPNASAIALGEIKNGSIDFIGDTDRYSINLTAGVSYGFAVNCTTLIDPFFELTNESGVVLNYDDDGGAGANSLITFTPTSSARYYLAARESGNNALGTYNIQAWELPKISIADAYVTEGDVGTKVMEFKITLSAPSPVDINLTIGTRAGTASTDSGDYQGFIADSFVMPAGITSKSFNLLVNGDKDFEPNEGMTVLLSSPDMAVIGDGKARGWIYDNDAPYALPTDSGSRYQWYLYPKVGANVIPVWNYYKGSGVKVGVFDQGIDSTHSELDGNLIFSLGRNASNLTYGGNPILSTDNHGTAVAGVIAAEKNGFGLVGIAPDASLISLYSSLSGNDIYVANEIVNAYTYALNMDVLNDSWGFGNYSSRGPTAPWAFIDNFKGDIFSKAGIALKNLADNGRSGLGTIVVQSAGNSMGYGDDTNLHNFQNSRYIVTVAATDYYGTVASYSSPGASVLISAPGGESINSDTLSEIYTTDRVGGMGYSPTDYASVSGTSFSAPVVSGIVALMLDANPNLGYRDVQQILAYSAVRVGESENTWKYNGGMNWNGGGLHYDAIEHNLGFGLIDAKIAVNLAETWGPIALTSSNALEVKATKSLRQSIPDGTSYLTQSINITNSIEVERAEVTINISHSYIGDLSIYLVSPSGTSSCLLSRPGQGSLSAYGQQQDNIDFTFNTVLNWGESGLGTWALYVYDSTTYDLGTLNSWTLNLIGKPESADDVYIYTDYFSESVADKSSRSLLSDSGGTDVLNAAAITTPLLIDLKPGAICTIDGQTMNISAGTSIESAIGGDVDDTIGGNSVSNHLYGMSGKDYVFGLEGNDTLDGGYGDDSILGGDGNDHIDGGEGQDTGVYLLNSSNYLIKSNAEGYTVEAISGNEGVDVIKNVEFIKFSNKTSLISALINKSPIASSQNISTTEDTAKTGTLTATDIDSTSLTYSKVAGPTNGTVVVNTNGTYTYTPNANFNGTDSFTFKANDGAADSAAETVSITVTAVNDAPAATAVSISTNEDTAKTGTLTATDVDSTSLTFTKVANPTNGTVTVNSNGTYAYTPNANFNGSDSFTFVAIDGADYSAAATVSITVSAVNDSPVGTIDIIGTAKQGEKLTATRSFTDADGLPALGDLFKVTWLADGAPFTGTISGTALSDTGKFIASVLEVTADLVGKKLSFSTTYTDNGGTQETVTSAQTVAVAALRAGITWSNASSLSTNESGTTATYGAVLDKAPTKDVTLTLTISDATEGVFVSTGTTTRDLVFTPSNWNQVQNVQVRGVDDGEYDRDVAYTISTKVTSNDLDYDGMRSGQGLATANVTVNNVDDDIPINWIGTDANDVRTGGPGADDLYGGYGRDDVSGGKGNDRIYGGYGDDVLSGDEGNDEIEGDQGDDKITAGAGDDNLKGGTGADTLFGGDGSDILNGGEDADSMDGGNGADTYYIDNPGDVVEDTGTDNSIDILYIASYLSAPVLLGRGVENATLNDSAGKGSITGNDSNNTLNGNASDNALSGGSGNDTLESGAGNDSVDAGTGDDLIVGGEGAGNDTYVGGSGTDTVKYTSAVNTILVNLLEGLANGQDIGTDKLSEIENLIGGQTGDTLVGDNNANNINAYTGNDTITGNGGNDTIDGGEGQDTVVYALNASSYTVTPISGGYQVIAKSGLEGTDTLLNVESLKFANKTVVAADFVAAGGEKDPAVAKFWKDNTKAPTDTKKADAVNLTDAIAILKMIVGLNVNSNNTPLSPYQAIAADFDQSGDVGLTDAIGVLKMVVGLSAPTPTWKYYDDTKLASAYTSAQSLNPKGWTISAVVSDTPIGTPDILIDSSVKLIGVLTGDVDGSWTGV